MKDYLIIGQGLAGSVLARGVLRRGLSLTAVDPAPRVNASLVAGGIFNPITGKRWVRTWGDTWLLPYAHEYYKTVEAEEEEDLFFEQPILRIFRDSEDVATFKQRFADPSYANYVNRRWKPTEIPPEIRAPFGGAELNSGGHVDVPALLAAIRGELDRKESRCEAHVNLDALEVSSESVAWQGEHYRQVVFCEGHAASQNPWFKAIPFRHAKGEVLTVEMPDFQQDAIINAGAFILPIGNNRFRVGATYEWKDLDEKPTRKGREELEEKLKAFCLCPYTVVDHQAAVRPIARDRAPVAGRHPERPHICILNGFGSKGVLYAPYYSRMLLEHLEDGQALDAKVSVDNHWRP